MWSHFICIFLLTVVSIYHTGWYPIVLHATLLLCCATKSREAAVLPYLHLVSQTEFSVAATPVSHSSIVIPSFTVEIHTAINEGFNILISVKHSRTLLYWRCILSAVYTVKWQFLRFLWGADDTNTTKNAFGGNFTQSLLILNHWNWILNTGKHSMGIVLKLNSVLLISNFRHALNVVCFLLGNSPAAEFCMPTCRNTLSVPSSHAGRCEEWTRFEICWGIYARNGLVRK